jgi:hypothetical protein
MLTGKISYSECGYGTQGWNQFIKCLKDGRDITQVRCLISFHQLQTYIQFIEKYLKYRLVLFLSVPSEKRTYFIKCSLHGWWRVWQFFSWKNMPTPPIMTSVRIIPLTGTVLESFYFDFVLIWLCSQHTTDEVEPFFVYMKRFFFIVIALNFIFFCMFWSFFANRAPVVLVKVKYATEDVTLGTIRGRRLPLYTQPCCCFVI